MRFFEIRSKQTATAVLSALMMLGLLVPALAQSGAIAVKIPFDFQIGSTSMPAGQYMVTPVPNGLGIRFSEARGTRSVAFITIPVTTPLRGPTQLVFHRYQETYFLAEMHWAGYSVGHGLRRSSVETELAKSVTAQPTILIARQ